DSQHGLSEEAPGIGGRRPIVPTHGGSQRRVSEPNGELPDWLLRGLTRCGRFRLIAAMAGPRIYLDHLATTPLLPAAAEAMRSFLAGTFGSASSIHQWGLAARDGVDHARAQFAGFVNAESPEDILFTSSGTESVNHAIKGLAWHPRRRGSHVVCSAIEH